MITNVTAVLALSWNSQAKTEAPVIVVVEGAVRWMRCAPLGRIKQLLVQVPVQAAMSSTASNPRSQCAGLDCLVFRTRRNPEIPCSACLCTLKIPRHRRRSRPSKTVWTPPSTLETNMYAGWPEYVECGFPNCAWCDALYFRCSFQLSQRVRYGRQRGCIAWCLTVAYHQGKANRIQRIPSAHK